GPDPHLDDQFPYRLPPRGWLRLGSRCHSGGTSLEEPYYWYSTRIQARSASFQKKGMPYRCRLVVLSARKAKGRKQRPCTPTFPTTAMRPTAICASRRRASRCRYQTVPTALCPMQRPPSPNGDGGEQTAQPPSP